MKKKILSIKNLNVSYQTPNGRLQAIRDISMNIHAGEIVGLVGESGSGKSTLMQSVLQLLAPQAKVESGQILLGETDILSLSPDKMRAILGDRISVVFQDPMKSLNPVLTIGRQMIDIQYRRQESKEQKRQRAIAMLHKVRIPDPEDRLNRYPHEFSGGMRQRVAIAMALMAEPELLVADEPTTALDATLEVATIDLLKELQSEIGCAILFITHHLGVVAELCDQMYVMYAGELVESGDVISVFTAPKHPYTQLLFACDPAQINQRTRHLPTIGGMLPNLVQVPEGCIFAARCPQAFDRCHTVKPQAVFSPVGDLIRCHLASQEAGQ
ncbi:ABC transporter ATP-binding protein [Pseudochrobactrum sp. MP213Fo]|uniref:ABC transporter ATP-binding protein n=1 Tax=Pseudochrobactrum sp. MP213Fo TaxID=3022250 RepID=UPI003BA09B5E